MRGLLLVYEGCFTLILKTQGPKDRHTAMIG